WGRRARPTSSRWWEWPRSRSRCGWRGRRGEDRASSSSPRPLPGGERGRGGGLGVEADLLVGAVAVGLVRRAAAAAEADSRPALGCTPVALPAWPSALPFYKERAVLAHFPPPRHRRSPFRRSARVPHRPSGNTR